jgi:Cu-Zn family superoxide dismutase
MIRNHSLSLALGAAFLLAGCASMSTGGPRAEAKLEPRSGSNVSGTVTFVQMGEKVRVEAVVRGLGPGEHGFHVHEAGDCSAADASSAKGHFNPGGKTHGEHAGDMPNLITNAAGEALLMVELTRFSLDNGPNGILGRSVVVHADPDDYQSQPAGNSGKRIACGSIVLR